MYREYPKPRVKRTVSNFELLYFTKLRQYVIRPFYFSMWHYCVVSISWDCLSAEAQPSNGYRSHATLDSEIVLVLKTKVKQKQAWSCLRKATLMQLTVLLPQPVLRKTWLTGSRPLLNIVLHKNFSVFKNVKRIFDFQCVRWDDDWKLYFKF